MTRLWLALFCAVTDGHASGPEPASRPWPTTSLADPVGRPRYQVERIEIRGNEHTAEAVILRHVELRAGEVLDDDAVEISRLRLLASGYFTEVKLWLEKGSNRGLVVLVIAVEERPPIPVIEGIYLGFSETTPLFAGVSLGYPNLLGQGIELGGGLVVAPEQQSYRLRLAGSSILGSPLGARLSLHFLNGREPVPLGDDPRGGGVLQYLRGGGHLGMSVKAGAFQSFTVDYHGEVVNADPRLDPRVRRIPRIQPGLSYLSAVRLAYQRDSRDRVFVPTSGSNLYVGAELSSALLLSAYEYTRFDLTYEQFFPLLDYHSLSLRLDLGMVQAGIARDNTAGAPFYESYFIGDYSFFRRFRNSLPRQLGLNFSAFSTYDDILGSLTLSYAWPIYLGPAVFYRIYLYGAVNIAEGTSIRELQGEIPGDDQLPVTVDVGFKLDTAAGSFIISFSYLVDLVL